MTQETTALTTTQPLTPSVWNMICAIASSAKESKKLGLFREQEAQVKMLTAWEHGFPLTSAFQVVHIIENVPALSPKAVWAKVSVHPEFGGYSEERLTDDKGNFLGYRITLKRKNGLQATRQFTLEDAKRAGLANKNNWQSYQENMCYWRAMGFVEDVVFPDVTLGMVRADDLGAWVDRDGNVVEGEWTVSPPSSDGVELTVEEADDPAEVLQQLVETHGAQKVMEAAGGRIPGTLEEVKAVQDALLVANGHA